jgi:hypothetical protein
LVPTSWVQAFRAEMTSKAAHRALVETNRNMTSLH